MNTSVGYYQAPRPPRVPLDEVLVKLHPDGFHDAEFEADGIDVGPGGISMRGSMLPQVGSSLRCQLETHQGAEPIRLAGEVVWAHETGARAGEFGVRFTRLSDEDQNRIEAMIQRWGRNKAEAPTVRLRLDGVDSSIVADLESETQTDLRVEQPLPFLAIGTSIVNEAAGRRGHLETVELNFDENIPRLVLSIGYESAVGADAGKHDDRDTLPDVAPALRVSQGASEQRLEESPRVVRYDPGDDLAPRPGAKRAIERLRSVAQAGTDRVVHTASDARRKVRYDMVPAVRRSARRSVTVLGRFVDALRGRLDDKPRRKQVPRSQAARAHLKNSRRHGKRPLLIGAALIALSLAGWGIYAWSSAEGPGPEPEITEAPALKPPSKPEPVASRNESRAVPVEAVPVADTTQSIDEVPKASPADAAGPPAPPDRVQGTSFGSDEVANAERFVLRMSNPVTTMDGLVEDNGFSVIVPGSLSLTRAGPVAAAHPDVEHAAIHNRGDFSELTIRFVAGRHPAYRVEARGPAIEIRIAR